MIRSGILFVTVLFFLTLLSGCNRYYPPSARTSVQLTRRHTLAYVSPEKREETLYCLVGWGGTLDVLGADAQGVFVRYNMPRRDTLPSGRECSAELVLHAHPDLWVELSEQSAHEVRQRQSFEQRLQNCCSSDSG